MTALWASSEAEAATLGRASAAFSAMGISIDTRTPWAHAVLAEAGYRYSSSIAPVRHDHYGWPDAPRSAFKPVSSVMTWCVL